MGFELFLVGIIVLAVAYLNKVGVIVNTGKFETMGVKSLLVKPYANLIAKRVQHWKNNAVEAQDKIFRSLIRQAERTVFGREHHFNAITNYQQFKEHIPIRDYEDFQPYINKIIEGESHVLWPGAPIYFAKTSGTTSGTKYIPITKDSIGNHFFTAQTALMCYMAESGNSKFADGRMMFLSGSPELEMTGNIPTGRLSGIVNHQIPKYLKANQLPTYTTNCIEDWELKLDKIVEETIDKNMTLISGIPPWVQMYFEKLIEKTGKPIKDIFPNFEMFVYGGVSYEPYRPVLEKLIGKQVTSIETYPASEGFIAFQDAQDEKGLLLNVDSGIFFEFIPADEISNKQSTRLSLSDVKTDVNYAIIINSNAGLWGYNLGDTVKFVSLNPYRIIVTGRIKHFISAFGEHVIVEEIEASINYVIRSLHLSVNEFTVAPVIGGEHAPSFHEWYIEFEKLPESLEVICSELNVQMCSKNVYYKDLIAGKVLQPLKIKALKKGAFRELMKQKGKLGGQHKVPRVSNERTIAKELLKYALN